MSETKISPAFEAYLAQRTPYERRTAIVIYRPPAKGLTRHHRGRMRTRCERVRYTSPE